MVLHRSFVEDLETKLKQHCLFEGSNGKKYVDFSSFTLSCAGQYLLGNIIGNKLGGEYEAIVAFEQGGYSIVSAVAFCGMTKSWASQAIHLYDNFNSVSGLRNVSTGAKLALVTDIVKNTKNTIKAANFLRENNFVVDRLLVVVTEGEDRIRKKLKKEDIEMISLYDLKDLCDV